LSPQSGAGKRIADEGGAVWVTDGAGQLIEVGSIAQIFESHSTPNCLMSMAGGVDRGPPMSLLSTYLIYSPYLLLLAAAIYGYTRLEQQSCPTLKHLIHRARVDAIIGG